jgi:uncharacterized membrane protein
MYHGFNTNLDLRIPWLIVVLRALRDSYLLMSNFPSIGIVGLVATCVLAVTWNTSLFFDHIFAKPFGRLKFLAREVRQVSELGTLYLLSYLWKGRP